MVPTKIIIDTDPGVDDITAILLALGSPEVDILAYVATFGNTDRDSAHFNILKTYKAIADSPDSPRFPNFRPGSPPVIVQGADAPLEGELHSAAYFHGRDGLGNIAERHPELDVDASLQPLACDLMTVLDIIKEHPPRTITYVVLGPMTSLALLAQQEPETITNRIGRVICMGGALDVPGNTTPSAEFNFFADPFAVKQLLFNPSSPYGLPLDRFLLLSLDVTALLHLPFELYKRAVDPTFQDTKTPSKLSDGKSTLVHLTSSFLENTREIMLSFGEDAMELHDVAAIWCAIESPPIQTNISANTCPLNNGWRARKRILDIERYGELTRGMLVVDRRSDASAYAPGANRAAVQKQAELLGLHKDDDLWESLAVPAQVEIEGPPDVTGEQGIWVISHTPGEDALLEAMMKRIWNVETTL